jgi:hypothetical protein
MADRAAGATVPSINVSNLRNDGEGLVLHELLLIAVQDLCALPSRAPPESVRFAPGYASGHRGDPGDLLGVDFRPTSVVARQRLRNWWLNHRANPVRSPTSPPTLDRGFESASLFNRANSARPDTGRMVFFTQSSAPEDVGPITSANQSTDPNWVVAELPRYA